MTPEEIKGQREALGWSRAELARRSFLHSSDVGKIESGRVQPYESQLKKIADAFASASDTPHTKPSPVITAQFVRDAKKTYGKNCSKPYVLMKLTLQGLLSHPGVSSSARAVIEAALEGVA